MALTRRSDERLIVVVAMATIPTLAPLASQVNNDNLAFFAGALTLFGLADTAFNRRRPKEDAGRT